MHQAAKNSTTSTSQSVRFPPVCCFNGTEVFIHRNPVVNDVVLSAKPKDWKDLLDAVALNKDDEPWIERRQSHARRDALNKP